MDTKFLKKNKFTIFIILFFIILLVLLLQIKNLFFPTGGDANYGNRLDNIVEVSQDTLSSAVDKLKENNQVMDAKIAVNGRILNITVTVDDALSLADAKGIASSVSSLFEESILNDYDLQVFVQKNNKEENDFPIIGYKAKKAEAFSFTKDRQKTVEEESE